MSSISEWSTKEEENTHLDDLTLSGEGGLYTNKIMCAVKEKMTEVDGKLDAVAGGLVFRGTKADYAALEAVTDPAVGDMYSVTALGGENYAWDGTAWDSLGTSDANVVHKTGDETIEGQKKFTSNIERKTTSFTRGALPESNLFFSMYISDANTQSTQKLGGVETAFRTSGGTGTKLFVFNNPVGEGATSFWKYVNVGISGSSYAFTPDTTNDMTLGSSSQKWKEIYANSGTISTSDARLKTESDSVPDEVLDAWHDVSFCQFQMLDAVAEKGAETARIHTGVIAQRIDDVFKAHGLDASRYGLFCHDAWEAVPERRDESGAVLDKAAPAGDAYSIRYVEALCMEAAYQRRRADRLEARIAALEARLNGD